MTMTEMERTEIVSWITENSVYKLRSGLRQDAMKGLHRLSNSQLNALQLMIKVRLQDEREKAQDIIPANRT
jgi:hypothetical protein